MPFSDGLSILFLAIQDDPAGRKIKLTSSIRADMARQSVPAMGFVPLTGISSDGIFAQGRIKDALLSGSVCP